MRRFLYFVLSGLLAFGVIFVTQSAWPAQNAQAEGLYKVGLDDFLVESFEAEYELARDSEGRSVMRTIERITILFPEYDQNRGVIRDIPSSFDGHSTNIVVSSVTDENGGIRPFYIETYGDYLSVVMAVPEGNFVHGRQTYVLEYTQRDITKYYADTQTDELYWDINGTEWPQAFGRVKADLLLSEELIGEMTGAMACYRGVYGASDPCQIRFEGDTVMIEESDLAPHENVTLAVAFAAGTFVAPPEPEKHFLEANPLLIYGGAASGLGAVLLTVIGVIRNKIGTRTGNPIIARYEPPTATSVGLSGAVLKAYKKGGTATILELAVHRKLRLIYDAETDVYGVQKLEIEGLAAAESKFANALFSQEKGENPTYWFSKTDPKLGKAAAELQDDNLKEAKKLGLIGKSRAGFSVYAILLLALAIALLAVHVVIIDKACMLGTVRGFGVTVWIWSSFAIAFLVRVRNPLTQAGAMMHDHLMGLREYIKLAEADRIRMLQSVSGAEVSSDRVVQVYEKLLPYAVLFGLEEEWQKELDKYYVVSDPVWYSGPSSSFSNGVSIGALHQVVSTSVKAHKQSAHSSSTRGSSFSSRGGSSGGGFSGGGGGGGGGRGI